MYFDIFMMLLDYIDDNEIEDYVKNNDITEFFEKYDEKSIVILRGLESAAIGCSTNKQNESYVRIVNLIKGQIYSAFLRDPFKYFDSYLFNEDNMFSFFERVKIRKLMKRIDKKVNEILDKKSIDSSERHFLMKYLKCHIDLDDERQKKLICEILSLGVVPSDNEEKNFLYNYISKWMLRESGNLDINCSVFSGYLSSDFRVGYARDNVIFIGIDDSQDLVSALQCVCHETQHVIQKNSMDKMARKHDAYDDYLSGFMYLERRLFGEDFYKKNYYFSRIEYEADEQGIKFTEKFLSTFKQSELLEVIDSFQNGYSAGKLCDFVMAPLNNGDYEKDFAEYIYVSMWDRVVQSDSLLIKEYPIIQRIYDNNGKKRSFSEMMDNDLSNEEDFYIFYNFVFDYIQEGCLDDFDDSKVSNQDKFFNNLNLIYKKVISKMQGLLDCGSRMLSSLDKSGDYGFSLNHSEIGDVFTGEVMYYLSFLTKMSKYFSKYSENFDYDFKMGLFNDVDKILSMLNRINRGEYILFKTENIPLLDEKHSELFSVYNKLRWDEVQKLYESQLENLVPLEYRDILVNYKGINYRLDVYATNILPGLASVDDVMDVDIDGEIVSFDKHIVSIISKDKGDITEVNDILILLDLMRKNYTDETNIHDDFVRMFKDIVSHYENDSSYLNLLLSAFENAEAYYQEHKFIDTPIYLNFQNLTAEVSDVVSRSQKK